MELLDPELTPLDALFVRCNGFLGGADLSPSGWRLAIDGEVERPLSLDATELAARFPRTRIRTVMECAGNGRSGYREPTDGIPWGLGAVGCIEFEGVRMADLLEEAGVKPSAVYVGHISPDATAAGTPALSRGLPIRKALAPETLIAFAANGAPLPAIHGGPLRVVAPGYPGSAWQKWLSRLWIRDREHDGARMTGLDYRLPDRPITPGAKPDPAHLRVIERMGPRALVTSHRTGAPIGRLGDDRVIGGWAWGHGEALARVDVSLDLGVSWMPAALAPEEHGPYAWRRFSFRLPPEATAMSWSCRGPLWSPARRNRSIGRHGTPRAIATTPASAWR